MKIGGRILKTGIAIALSLYIAHLLKLPSPSFAGIAAAFAIQPSIYRSYQSVIEQFQANLIGAFFAIVFTLLFTNNPIIIGFTVMLVIGIALKLKLETTIPLALVTVIAIMESPTEQFVEFSFIRFGTIILGVMSAFLVNLVFFPPRYETKLYHQIVDTTEEIIKWIRINTRHASGHIELKEEIDGMKDRVAKLDSLFTFYKEERNYFEKKKRKFAKSRKTVLFRQMLLTTSQALETLKRLHRLENEMHHMPGEFQELIKLELDSLSSGHEQLLLQFVGKIKSQIPIMEEKEALADSIILEDYIALYEAQLDQSEVKHSMVQLFPLISMIMEYKHQLTHLEKLLDSFQTYHTEDNEVEVDKKKD
ncbi:aromatic acid exporter family protein [Bacillus salitolerans]|uniref:Aromatic acid exporter family protein n=1 Tax=Bacillus salitolerans TaxID=1437434 RepID=A0ABW4LJ70_9BACI